MFDENGKYLTETIRFESGDFYKIVRSIKSTADFDKVDCYLDLVEYMKEESKDFKLSYKDAKRILDSQEFVKVRFDEIYSENIAEQLRKFVKV